MRALPDRQEQTQCPGHASWPPYSKCSFGLKEKYLVTFNRNMTYLPESVEKMEQQVSVLLGVPHGFPASLQLIIFFITL